MGTSGSGVDVGAGVDGGRGNGVCVETGETNTVGTTRDTGLLNIVAIGVSVSIFFIAQVVNKTIADSKSAKRKTAFDISNPLLCESSCMGVQAGSHPRRHAGVGGRLENTNHSTTFEP